jgi:hypothetical protein
MPRLAARTGAALAFAFDREHSEIEPAERRITQIR